MAGGYFLLFFLASTANKEKYLDINAGSSEVSKDVCTESGSKELFSCSHSSNVLTVDKIKQWNSGNSGKNQKFLNISNKENGSVSYFF